MLKRLTVRNLAIVERAEALFGPGLNVLTGETGAGKSILMDALELVLGSRADALAVRDGAREAEVEADFGDAVVRRTVTAQGRSRAWIDDESVSVAELREFVRGRVDMHGPTSSQKLLEEDFQRGALDAFGGVSTAAYGACFARRAGLLAEIGELSRAAGEDDAESVEMLRFQVGELEEAGLTEDDDTLAQRHAAAAHAEEVLADAGAVTEALGGDESVVEILAQLQSRFRALARHLPQAEEWAARAAELADGANELSRTVADAASGIDCGDEDLEALDARLTLVNRLRRKYLPRAVADESGVAALLEVLERKRSRLDEIEHRGERIAALQGELATAEAELRGCAGEMTKARRAAAKRLAKKVTAELHDLGFRAAVFDVVLEPAEPAEHGCDRVTFFFGPNPGEAARPLAAIASSGEIARVMLALKSVLAAHDSTETLVFDEIDANIGGEVGRVVGEKLKAVSRRRQVVAITHLPQSAVYGDRHLVVSKTVSGGRTRTTISEVEGDSRVSEIARMLGGEKLTSVVKKHAEELLKLSR